MPLSMPIYFAPLEGLTDAPFRRVHHAHFGGVSKYFIPFISPTQNLEFTAKDLRAISPDQNAGLFSVPQLLTRNAEHFLWAADRLAEMGYPEVNLNLGCPSGTVTAKGKGSGQLKDKPALDAFLAGVYAKTPIPVSIKTRIGYASPDEFEPLLDIFTQYPVHELIVHPRTRGEFYKGRPHRAVYAGAQEQTDLPLVYNGDLFTADDCTALIAECPKTTALMLGRGLIANPALAQQMTGGAPLTRDSLRSFHDDLLEAYRALYPERIVVGRMREFMNHAACCFEDAKKPLKMIWKAQLLDRYEEGVRMMFGECAFADTPGFHSK